ncbi:MAG: hypothetical protein U1D55_16755 [Phycisphaerae bacterium]
MTRQRRHLVGIALFAMTYVNAQADNITFSLAASSATYVAPADMAYVDVLATFDQPLASVAFELQFSGRALANVESRTIGPIATDGLAVLAGVSQMPFVDTLPHQSNAGPMREVIFDDSFDGVPGGPTDGATPNAGVLLERLHLRILTGGDLTITLANVSAVTTFGAPDGALFTTAQVNPNAASAHFIGCGAIDCNNNGIGDACDIAQGVARDLNANGIPDSCEGCVTDLTADGRTDEADLGLFFAAWNSCGGDANWCAACDYNRNGCVDESDLGILLADFGCGVSP